MSTTLNETVTVTVTVTLDGGGQCTVDEAVEFEGPGLSGCTALSELGY